MPNAGVADKTFLSAERANDAVDRSSAPVPATICSGFTPTARDCLSRTLAARSGSVEWGTGIAFTPGAPV